MRRATASEGNQYTHLGIGLGTTPIGCLVAIGKFFVNHAEVRCSIRTERQINAGAPAIGIAVVEGVAEEHAGNEYADIRLHPFHLREGVAQFRRELVDTRIVAKPGFSGDARHQAVRYHITEANTQRRIRLVKRVTAADEKRSGNSATVEWFSRVNLGGVAGCPRDQQRSGKNNPAYGRDRNRGQYWFVHDSPNVFGYIAVTSRRSYIIQAPCA